MCGMIDKHIDTDLGWFYTSSMNYDQQAPSVNQYQNNKHFPCWTQWFFEGARRWKYSSDYNFMFQFIKWLYYSYLRYNTL